MNKPPFEDLRLGGCEILLFMSILLLCFDHRNGVTLSSIRWVTVVTSDIVEEVNLILANRGGVTVQSLQLPYLLCWLQFWVVFLLI